MALKARSDGKVFTGHVFTKEVIEYALKPKYVKTGDGEDDFVIIKVPYIVDKYDMDKTIKARTDGCDLKSYIARMKQGEVLCKDDAVYGDSTNNPDNLADALTLGKQTEAIIDAAGDLDKTKLEELRSVFGMTKKQFEEYVSNIVKGQQVNNEAVVEANNDKGEDING